MTTSNIRRWGSLDGVTIDGKVVSIYDGDSLHVHATIEGQLYDITCRLMGIDAPELKVGKESLQALRALVNETNGAVVCQFGKNDKYGRVLVTLYGDPTKGSINSRLVESGFAKEYFGGKKDV
jgi:endonuclease YncB( thermonuclease family)